MKNKRTIVLLEVALVATLSYLLSLIPFFNIGNMFEIYVGVIPIIILSWRRGAKPACLAGLVWGVLKIITGRISALTPLQVILEYLVAFWVTGLSGLYSSRVKNSTNPKKPILLSTALSVGAKYFIHFLAGYVFWARFSPEGMNPWLYTLLVNGASGVVTYLVCILVFRLMGTNLNRFINVD